MPLAIVQLSIEEKLKKLFPSVISPVHFSSVGGGCINETYRIHFDEHEFFCKVNSAVKFPHLFKKESHGLKLIAEQNIIKVHEVIDCFEAEGWQILLLEWIHEGERTAQFWEKFGEQLSALHQVSNEYFGWNESNYMGSVPQFNQPSDNWVDFFSRQRLQPLIDQCLSQNLLTPKHLSQFENLYKQLPNIFDQKQKPSLLHGDLWSGNFICTKNAEPVLIDTAVYFGHPSIDLGMTTLFGGFHSRFYEAYNYHSSFPSNYAEQWQVCNLYPLLIHLLLFGSSYLSQIGRILNRYD
jgi:fructosamine-3-kinase